MNWKVIVSGLVNRFKEPSSWAGLGALVALAGLHISAAEVSYIVDIGVGVSGLLAFFIPEQQK